MLNMFTFDVFLVCQSLGQTVTAIALFIFGRIPQEYIFSQKIKDIYLAWLNIFSFWVKCCPCKSKNIFLPNFKFFLLFVFCSSSLSLLRSYGQFVLDFVYSYFFFCRQVRHLLSFISMHIFQGDALVFQKKSWSRQGLFINKSWIYLHDI